MLPRLCGCHSSPIGRTRQTDCSCLAGTRPRSMNHSVIGRKLQKLFQTVSFPLRFSTGRVYLTKILLAVLLRTLPARSLHHRLVVSDSSCTTI